MTCWEKEYDDIVQNRSKNKTTQVAYNGVFEFKLNSKLEKSFPFQTELGTNIYEPSLDIPCMCDVHTLSISGGGGTKGN